MKNAIVFLTLLIFTPLEGKHNVIIIQVWFYYVICIKFWMTQNVYIKMNFNGYSKLCHHCVLWHTNIIHVQKHIIFYIHNLRLFFSLCLSFREDLKDAIDNVLKCLAIVTKHNEIESFFICHLKCHFIWFSIIAILPKG